MQSTLIAVDLAKNVFEIAVSRKPGKVAERHRLSRARFLTFFAERQPAVVLLRPTRPHRGHDTARRRAPRSGGARFT